MRWPWVSKKQVDLLVQENAWLRDLLTEKVAEWKGTGGITLGQDDPDKMPTMTYDWSVPKDTAYLINPAHIVHEKDLTVTDEPREGKVYMGPPGDSLPRQDGPKWKTYDGTGPRITEEDMWGALDPKDVPLGRKLPNETDRGNSDG